MIVREKIEKLTRSWYGYSLFAAVVSLLSVRASGALALTIGLGLSIVFNAIALVISLAIVTFFGRKLMARSNATRMFLIVFSALFAVLGVLGTLSGAWAFLHDWSLSTVLGVVLTASATLLHARSFRVLNETAVRAYFV
jgi:hypothetical protein